MFLSLATTYRPATDLGFLLMKHPDRVHEVELAFGKAVVFFPEASDDRCEAVLVLGVDPVGLVRGRGSADGLLDQYVNDRPYAASSFLSVALNRLFRSAMAGSSRERPELASRAIPLRIAVTPLPCRGSEDLVHDLFEPLGWEVKVVRIAGDHRPSRYVSMTLRGSARLADALIQIYVLIPVLDADKHYWVGDDEIEKLLAKGGAWLASHPERELIASRYLKRRRDLTRAALARLAPEEAQAEAWPGPRSIAEDAFEAPLRLHDIRLDMVAEALAGCGAAVVADLGCGDGKLLARLIKNRQFTRIIGLDASAKSLERAAERLKLGQAGGPKEGRVALLHGALTYRDERWHGADAAVLVEVVEHLDADRLPAMEQVVFGTARPPKVIVTTPNAEHNVLYPTLPEGAFRHPDHRFEWTRAEFRSWASAVEARFGYSAAFSEIGDADEVHGAPTQMAVFTR
ncbi:MAG: 3' terminal RNA ribose 2'-O-methyltransferase Hen1 [Rhizobiales bacterium]|nr:3' terminal RNA ribose 2'-O-methyltransferase Hen1 [Hyphomicrobiales bacterium]